MSARFSELVISFFSNFFLRGNIHISINFSRKCDPLQYFGVNYDGFFPPHYMNLYIYTILQAFVVIFLAGNYFTRERGLDTMETVHYRSVSNWELVLGYYLGFLVSFGVGALFSAFLGALCSLVF